MFQNAAVPYNGFHNVEVAELVCKGVKLEKPESCSDQAFSLLLKCWNADPQSRPSFSEVLI